MKNKFKLVIILVLCMGGLACDKVEEKDVMIANIRYNNSECVPVSLTVYKNNKYKLYTSYKACKPDTPCNDNLVYLDFIEGTYKYDIFKIIEASVNANNKTYFVDNMPDYVITLGEEYIEKYGTLSFAIEKNSTNKYLNEFLKSINVDLKKCSTPAIN